MISLDPLPTQANLELELSLLCGQVFRWKRVGDSIIGVDGSNYAKFTLATKDELIIKSSNVNHEIWNQFFQLNSAAEETWKRFDTGDPRFSIDFSHLRGLRLLRPTDPLEVLFCFLCTSNNHLTRIQKMVDALSELGETLVEIDKTKLKRFPSLDRLRSVSESDLRIWGFGYRGATIPVVVSQLLDRGEGWLQSLQQASYSEAHLELTKLAGVGPKLADCICLYGLHFDSAVPVDTHLHQAVIRRYLPSSSTRSMTPSLYRDIGDAIRDRFGDLAGWAQLILYYDNLQRNRRGSSQ